MHCAAVSEFRAIEPTPGVSGVASDPPRSHAAPKAWSEASWNKTGEPENRATDEGSGAIGAGCASAM
jgi:hypothetical protein